MRTEWNGFIGGDWEHEINVRDFIQKNYHPYDGDEAFLAGPTQNTLCLLYTSNFCIVSCILKNCKSGTSPAHYMWIGLSIWRGNLIYVHVKWLNIPTVNLFLHINSFSGSCADKHTCQLLTVPIRTNIICLLYTSRCV